MSLAYRILCSLKKAFILQTIRSLDQSLPFRRGQLSVEETLVTFYREQGSSTALFFSP